MNGGSSSSVRLCSRASHLNLSFSRVKSHGKEGVKSHKLSTHSHHFAGVLGAGVNGCIWPAFALLFGEILDVFALPPDEILDEIHMWAGLFIVLGVVSGTGVFLKVQPTCKIWGVKL